MKLEVTFESICSLSKLRPEGAPCEAESPRGAGNRAGALERFSTQLWISQAVPDAEAPQGCRLPGSAHCTLGRPGDSPAVVSAATDPLCCHLGGLGEAGCVGGWVALGFLPVGVRVCEPCCFHPSVSHKLGLWPAPWCESAHWSWASVGARWPGSTALGAWCVAAAGRARPG